MTFSQEKLQATTKGLMYDLITFIGWRDRIHIKNSAE
jgi:hypothetical protein